MTKSTQGILGDYVSSSSNDTSGTTSPSSLESPTAELKDPLAQKTGVRLPYPFLPTCLVKQDSPFAERQARQLPANLKLPLLPPESACTVIDTQDSTTIPGRDTPDSWVTRDSRLVRLTGKHPFNAEARIRDLYTAGFITPTNLFFVRNHGAVPKVDFGRAEKWELKVHGLCANPTTFTLTDLRTRFRVVTLPITLVCAGNRRKEQNVVAKSLGFSWGAGGVSTALFTGVYLADVLEYIRPIKGAKHVVFEGTDDLPNGPYGTRLEPDHGFPLRLVVPSQIGGRSVKWLARIELSPIESQHHLHFHDNKVLPTTLTAEQARAEKHWWYDPRYLIRELSVNSAIAYPNHDEVLDTTLRLPTSSYTVRGYAYAGGGRRITRVEVTLDEGSSWRLAQITYFEDAFREVEEEDFGIDPIYGVLGTNEQDQNCFCWSFWECEVAIQELKAAGSIMVRAMDESLAVQPRDMYWNPTGMMNNWWFKVCIHDLEDGKLRFEHPTMAGTQPGGWMQRFKDQGLDPAYPRFTKGEEAKATTVSEVPKPSAIVMTNPVIKRMITRAELESKEGKEKAWFVVNGEVYEGLGFLEKHPGGAPSIQLVAGEDATDDFLAIHSPAAKQQLADFHIGTFVSSSPSPPTQEDTGNLGPGGAFLHAKKWKKIELIKLGVVSHNAKIFRFALDHDEQKLGLPTGMHVYVRIRRRGEGEIVQRAYTPLSDAQNARGFVDFLIKIYRPCPEYPLGGRMSVEFDRLVVGDEIEVKGPVGRFEWLGRRTAQIHGLSTRIDEIGFVCGGSGVTPILQVVRAIFNETSLEDAEIPDVWVLDVNRNVDDILCREDFERLDEVHGSGRLKIHHSLTGKEVPKDWKYSTGRASEQMLRAHLPSPGDKKLVCICGPPAMEQAVKGALISDLFCKELKFIGPISAALEDWVGSGEANRLILRS
ncbi:hypothetical protein NLJ89_g8077 [Agrocybe chaxingu]|uniref:Nitrate reductase [NADPH] n=1 Tax=Agrocybe chaxingu TaxID=84603 RepID=A0A9W8MT29_9AGAR|nr:hypothetical protein NLJ89_g8077 [Agrocybe chaxingu]